MPEETNSQDGSKRAFGADLVIPVVGVVFTVYYFFTIWDLTWEAQVNGFFLGSVLIALVAVLLVRGLLMVSRGEANFSLGPLGTPASAQKLRLGLLALSIAFIVVIEWLGFTLTTFSFMVIALYMLGVRTWLVTLGAPVLLCGVGYVLFILILDSRFPHGPVENFLMWLF